MANETTSGRTRLRGVQHPPEADIQNIRDLLRGYGSEGSLIKELIQNAEDAGARHLDLILSPGIPEAVHPLLRTPGLCAVNDGIFEPKHRDAIFRLGLGTKGADPRAIGRFGKGLKSVFALCEAFFVAARPHQIHGWENEGEVCEFFNPWNGWRHADWDDAFDSQSTEVFSHISHKVSAFSQECPHWLAFWLPLRHPNQHTDAKGRVAWIHEGSTGVLPGDDGRMGAKLAAEFRKLAPSLVTLRNLKRIRVIDASAGTSNTMQWSLAEGSRRISEPGSLRKPEPLTGSMIVEDSQGLRVEMKYAGIAGTLPESYIAEAKAKHGWPTIVDISETGSSADQKAKGEPHWAAILTTEPSDESGLELRWSVFFPVGEQPDGNRSVLLPRLKQAITLNLHGFFFLDTERRRVDGLQQHFADSSHACLDWNQIIAKEGTLAHLPMALAAFAAMQSFNADQCAELANAVLDTWVWSKFDAAVRCYNTWRPRWRTVADVWEIIPVKDPVCLIPKIAHASEVLARIPMLASISEAVTLVARDRDGKLPGLHDGKVCRWSEDLVLRMLSGVELSATADQAAADWLNSFLTHLHDTNALTPAIRQQVSHLPLLPVRVARTGEHRRVSADEWDAAIASGQLYAPSPQTEDWLRFLHPALPECSCIIHEWNIPKWFAGEHAPPLDIQTAAAAVVAQSRLGEFTARAGLVRRFLSQPVMPGAVCLAIRYLMHGHAAQAGNGEPFLFMPSTQPGKLIWSRLIKQLLIHEGGENSWRLLHQQWAAVLSPQAQQDLKVFTIDEQGAWEELMTAQTNFSTLEFPATEWSDADVATLLHGLFQAGQSDSAGTLALLRKLRLHELRGQAGERVSIAATDGHLDYLFVLHTLNFEDSIPQDLVPLWERFLSTTKVVKRIADGLASTVQENLFRQTTPEGDIFEAWLDWNYVVRRCLDFSDPCNWSPLIMEALSHGDQAVRGLGGKLKQTEWLPLSTDGSLAPDAILLIDGLEAEIQELLDPAKDGLGGTRALSPSVIKHDGFTTLKKYFPTLQEALELLGHWLKDKPSWHLGLAESSLPTELGKFLLPLENLAELPGATLLAKLWRLSSQAKNHEWDASLKESIWPALFRPFAYDQGGSARLERVISQLATTASRFAFDAYLRQAVADSMVVPMLPRLSLVNKCGQWLLSRKLIWPSENLDLSAQLCDEQARILSPLHPGAIPSGHVPGRNQTTPIPRQGNQLSHEPNFDSQVATLANFLLPFRNGNVGDILPAALVAVLGDYPHMRALLRDLLQAGLGQQPEDFIALLLGEQRERLIAAARSERFLIEIVRGNSTNATTVTGDTVMVELTSDVTTLLVGDPSNLWCRYFYHYREDTACHLLRLRWIETPDELTDPIGIFSSTIETILLKAHCNGDSALCPRNLKEVLGDVADAGQADLRRSQLYLLDMAESRLKELAVKGMPQFEKVLRQFSEARQARVEAELMRTQAPARARQKLETAEALVDRAKCELLDILKSPQEEITRRTLVKAVRRKMTDFQYSLASVALELFQNADDAVAEWEEMKTTLLPSEDQFVVHLDLAQRRLELIHWGRPINRHAFPGFQLGFKRGYDQDLQKMLTLNFSDKGVSSDDQPVIVTGRFGLGFKTVFFVADQPEVISGRLAFEIRGGFYPVPLPPEQANDLRQWAENIGGQGLVPTAIRLTWSDETSAEDLTKAFGEFARIAPLLAIFSRRIRTLTVNTAGKISTIASQEKLLSPSGRFTHIRAGSEGYLCFRCRLHADARPASVLLPIDASGVSSLPEGMPRLWITTPTTEHSDLRWAVNAPFKPDAGRQRLALNNPMNRQIAEEVAHAWLESLLELYDETQTHWDAFARQLDLHSTASFDSWWRRFWSEMTRSWPVCKWENLSDGGQVLGYIAWGQGTGAMLRLVQQRAAIPANLPGAYARLVKSGVARFSVTGLLSEQANGCLALIAEWASVQDAFPPGQTVDVVVAQFLKQTLPAQKLHGELNLRTALKAELGENQEVNHLIAERLGHLVVKCKAIFEPGSPYAPEVLPVLSSLNQSKLLASDGKYYPAAQLVCPRSLAELIEKDEPLRAAFAPRSAVLSSGYSDTALHFFVKARGQLMANAVTLSAWVHQATPEQLPASFQYLINGELGQQLADELKRPWLDTKRLTPEFQSLSANDLNELERKFLRHQIWIPQSVLPIPITEVPVIQLMPAEVAFRCVSEWWARENITWTAIYESRTYPSGFPGRLPWPGEADWDAATAPSAQARWLLLFIHAALVPLGFNRIGRDQSFTRFLVENDWVDVLTRVSHEPHALFTALDKYLGSYLQNTEFHFQMRQFIAFYAVSRNLDAFLYSLHAAENCTQPDAFNLVFSPNANPVLSGTGIVAPPLSGMLGMGTCQLLRELYRLGRLKNPQGYQFAFTPIRKVRRLCTQLFGTSEGYAGAAASVTIFSELSKKGAELKLDPTFNRCFDLPLQILAENKGLRTTVLRQEFEAEAADSIELDAAPRDLPYQTL